MGIGSELGQQELSQCHPTVLPSTVCSIRHAGTSRRRDDRLLKEGIITPGKCAEWAAPVVPILKPVGTVKLCADYKLTMNTISLLEQYLILQIQDLFAALTEGKRFSKLDTSHVHQQRFIYNRPCAFWGGVSTSYIPKDDRRSITRESACCSVP